MGLFELIWAYFSFGGNLFELIWAYLGSLFELIWGYLTSFFTKIEGSIVGNITIGADDPNSPFGPTCAQAPNLLILGFLDDPTSGYSEKGS